MHDLRDYQLAGSFHVAECLDKYNICYLAWEERTGKTLTALHGALKYLAKVENPEILVITTAKSRDNTWQQFSMCDHYLGAVINCISFNEIEKHYDEYMTDKPSLVILDECHNFLSQIPKVGKYAKFVRALCNKLCVPIIYISATPYANNIGQLYQQLSMSNYSIWDKYSNYYSWYKDYGTPGVMYLRGISINVYDKFTEEQRQKILNETKNFMLFKTRKEIGFEIMPEDHIHYVEPGDTYYKIKDKIIKNKYFEIRIGGLDALINGINKYKYEFIGDSPSKIIHGLAMLEGGTMILNNFNNEDESILVLKGSELNKINYIKDTWGDNKDMVIMYYYKGEKDLLDIHFKEARVLQSTTFAESITLTEKHLIIYSQDWRASKYIQRRARQCSLERKEPINVHFILFKGGISERIYNVVSRKGENFNANREFQLL